MLRPSFILIALLGGVVITVVAGWLCIHRYGAPHGVHGTRYSDLDWVASVPAEWPATSKWTMDASKGGVRVRRQTGAINRTEGRCTLTRRDAGWPMKAVSDVVRTVEGRRGPYLDGTGIVFRGPRDAPDSIVMPIVPLWPGFIVDSMLYGTMVWFVMSVPLWARSRARRARGRCPRCAYDLAGLDSACPECGWVR